MNKDIPVISLQRLPVYLNYLKSLPEDKIYVSSGLIAEALGMGEVLVRKDLAYTSAQGRTRVGYSLKELISAIEDYLGCNDVKEAVIVGAGELGNALLSYGGFVNYGIELAAAFDNDPVKIGKEIAGKPVYDFAEAENVIKKRRIKLAVLCVPASVAQAAADKLIGCGVERILNFAPVLIKAADSVTVRNIDVAANLAILSSM